jgi:hypothetical protein
VNSDAGELVPSKGRATGKTTYVVSTANPFDAQGNPILGLPFRYVEAGAVGHGTLTGRVEATTRSFVELAIVNGTLVARLYGEWIATAANGDHMWGTHEYIRPVSGPPVFVGTFTTTGGDGRFEGITGMVELNGTLYPDEATGLDSFEYEFEGVLESIGSNRRRN